MTVSNGGFEHGEDRVAVPGLERNEAAASFDRVADAFGCGGGIGVFSA